MTMRKRLVSCPPFGQKELVWEEGYIKYSINYMTYNGLVKNWSAIWTQMHLAVVETIKEYNKVNLFGSHDFTIHMMKSGGWIMDDVMFELLFIDDPEGFSIAWVTGFKDGKLIHRQASF